MEFREAKMMTTVRSLAMVVIAAMTLQTTALACGDSLYRAGKGVSYRTYSAPLPGNLLVMGTSEGAKQFAADLASSGHAVRLVSTSDELTRELKGGSYDVVIAPFSEHQVVASSGSRSSFLPIAGAGGEEKVAKQTYGTVMVPEKHELKHYLKAIHRALKDNA